MSSEALFFALALADLSLVLFAYRLGRQYLVASVVANLLFTNIVSSKLVVVFGLTATVANPTYAGVFLATDLLSEHYGKKAATQAIWLGFFCVVWIPVLGPVVAAFPAIEQTRGAADAIGGLFAVAPRVALASMAAYLFANHVDVALYDKLRAVAPGRGMAFIRNNGSTLTAQAVDQVLFVGLAFGGTMPVWVLLEVLASGYLLKGLVALLDTPFLYLSFIVRRGRGRST